MNLSDLSPERVWYYFERITQIPRPSGHEEKIIAYLKEFAQTQGLFYRQDEVGNLVICKPAQHTSSSHIIALQSHVDMVCEKNSETDFDFLKDSIRAFIDSEWVKAQGTTLGADCGIGIAIQLALLENKNIIHPALECLFTIDEETGLTGASELGKNMLQSEYLINLDSEDEGEIFIGCAGGIDTVATFSYTSVPRLSHTLLLQIVISGLQGGHSGDDINKNLANANILMVRLLMHLYSANLPFQLIYFDGGNLRNAIPREATVHLFVPLNKREEILRIINESTSVFKQEYHISEPGLSITTTFEETDQKEAIDSTVFVQLLKALYTLPNGVMAMSQDIPGFVETSTNLASVKTRNKTITISTSQRSSLESKKMELAHILRTVFESYGAEVSHSNSYPGWAPIPHSSLLNIFKESYLLLFKKEIKVKTVHAGLECGLFLEKYPHLEMVSVGPTIRQVHSPNERLEIKTVDMFWQLLLEVLKRL